MTDSNRDPREDRHPNDGTSGESIPEPPTGEAKPAPGGVGTGTANDPAERSDAGSRDDDKR
jgi:hypothetical protein